MTDTYRVTGTVPDGSPLRALTGRQVSMPAESLEDLLRRVTEMRKGGVPLKVQTPTGAAWVRVAWVLAAEVIAAVVTAVVATVAGEPVAAGVAAGAMVLGCLAIFVLATRHEAAR